MIEWKKLNIDSRYSISEYGDVRNDKTGHILKQQSSKKGYKRVDISYNKGNLIHQLVFEHFIGKRDLNLVIDHIDGDKNNNHYSNLQQISSKENTRKGNRCIRIKVEDLHGNIKEYVSGNDLRKELNYYGGSLHNLFNSKIFKKHYVLKEVGYHTYEN